MRNPGSATTEGAQWCDTEYPRGVYMHACKCRRLKVLRGCGGLTNSACRQRNKQHLYDLEVKGFLFVCFFLKRERIM